MADETLEQKVNKMTISYNLLHPLGLDMLYLSNILSNLRPRIGRYAQLQVPHRFKGRVYHKGLAKGRLASVKDPVPEHKNVYYSVAYDDDPKENEIQPLAEWAEDPVRTRTLNDNEYPQNRRTAMGIGVVNGPRDVSMYQRDKRLLASWYGLPLKIALAPIVLPLSLVSRTVKRLFGGELVELGNLYEVENIGIPGDTTLDQNLARQILSLGLGKYYTLRDQDERKVATVRRQPLVKLLTLGLKNRYKVKLYDETPALVRSMYGIVDYLQHELKFRRVPKKQDIRTADLFRYQ